MSLYKTGDVFRVDYPFWVDTPWTSDEEGEWKQESYWEIGCKKEEGDPEVGIPTSYYYHALGKMVVRVEETCKLPGREERIFYTRKWIDPEGKEFGKNTLHVIAKSAFTRLLKGHRYMESASQEVMP